MDLLGTVLCFDSPVRELPDVILGDALGVAAERLPADSSVT